MNNADLIVKTLREAGVTHGFGVPSGNVLPFIEAMRAGGIEFVLTAHEGSAAFAADVMGRLTGAPGLCVATLGPGATNLTTGVGDAWLDRSPMVAITCNLNVAQLGRRIQMYIDHHALFAPLTKTTLPLRTGAVAQTLSQALQTALDEPVGPVHLDLPEDVALAEAGESMPALPEGRGLAAADETALAAFDARLRQAQRPVAVIGAAAMRMRDHARLLAFIEHHQLPFATTTMAKGLIDERHPLSVGCIERACRQLQRRFLRGADLIVGLGYDVVEVEYEAWIDDVPLIALDIETVDAADSVRLEAELVGDLDDALQRLVTRPAHAHQLSSEAVGQHRRAYQQALRPNGEGFMVHQAIDVVRDVLPRNGILAFDVGAHTHQIAGQWTAHTPRSFLITNGWSSMGFGLPAAIAAKLARPMAPVVAVIGDGCFQMTCGEVATARRLGLALPIVVLVDDWLSLIQIKQTRRQMPIYGTRLAPEQLVVGSLGNVSTPAHYFGVPAVGVDSAEQLRETLTGALNADGPTVIEARVRADHYMQTVFD
ncbi:MAG: thiamine pyrophosphate-binding protein [Gammaproteobacteria bacterium]|nr:thiamine pyrophosphate-binding protein [Gammaproteobacteria bacterium]